MGSEGSEIHVQYMWPLRTGCTQSIDGIYVSERVSHRISEWKQKDAFNRDT